ncbi:unnamed protein product [Miscanthus lutarioriparius]|uniref:Uncharacterized protein n=1 Tax=Miscanthus lutarioriparius TaxID=422564 RepID=A0A811NW40_9POAL|nr:unnamed protein product [Miscanthus lutarioriparius]
MCRRVGTARDRCLELERVIAGRAGSGSLRLDNALKLFDELLPYARAASVTAFNQLLTAVSRASGQRSSTSESGIIVSLFNRMVRDCSIEVAPDLYTYNILIGCFCRMGRLENGFATFGLILKTGWRVNGIVINQLLKGLCDDKRVGEAMDLLLRRMPEFGLTSDVVSYNTLLKGFCNEKRADEALELLHVMPDGQGVSPDVVTYNTVIDGMCKAEAVDRAEGIFQQMIDKGVKPDNVAYTCLIHGYLSIGQWEEAVPRKGIKPDITIYGIMLHEYGTKGALSEMHGLLNLMAANGISPNHHIFNTVFCAYAKEGMIDEAMHIFIKMRHQGLSPNNISYGALIDALCKLGRVDDAVLQFNQMINEGVTPGNAVFSSLVYGLCFVDKWEKVEELLFEMLNQGIRHNIVFFNTILCNLCREGWVMEARRLFDSMSLCSKDLQLDIITFNIMIDALFKVGRKEDAMDLFAAIPANGLVPSVVTYCLIAETLIEEGSLEEFDGDTRRAGAYLSKLDEKNFSLEASTTSMLISLFSRKEYQHDAKSLPEKYRFLNEANK